MGWRTVVVNCSAKVDYKMDYLVVRSAELTNRIHISELSVLLVESTAVSITSYAINELIQSKVKIIFCDQQRNPCGEIISTNGNYSSCAKIRQQIRWEEANKKSVWTIIVRKKIEYQRNNLAKLNLSQSNLLNDYIGQIELNDSSNREGHAAKVYFNALFGKDFSRDDDNYINAALNYGYSIILSAINREIVAAGYLTTIGIFHDNTFNAFNLGCDFIEPLRPLVDSIVLDMDHNQFEQTDKMKLVDILNKEVTIGGNKQHLLYAINLYCQSIFAALLSGDLNDIQMISYEP